MIKIAHEAPLSIMRKVQHMTDYDYALVHLFEDPIAGPQYLSFFDEALRKGREVILDNSVFELGQAFDIDRFRSWIKALKPTYYIIPDKLRDSAETRRIAKEWQPIKGSRSIGVVQGQTMQDLVDCYLVLSEKCDKIAFPFNLPIYLSLAGNENTVEEQYCRGRKIFMDRLLDMNVLNLKKPHHLLGTVLPQEVCQYQDDKYFFLDSIDTSNPVIHGYYGVRYTDSGLDKKIQKLLCDLISIDVQPKQWTDIKFNIKKYRFFAGYVGE